MKDKYQGEGYMKKGKMGNKDVDYAGKSSSGGFSGSRTLGNVGARDENFSWKSMKSEYGSRSGKQ